MKKTYTYADLKADVLKEATMLRQLATKREKDKLEIEFLDASAYSCCIYGQMTGHCPNNRAVFLIQNCCQQYFVNALVYSKGSVSEALNGKELNVSADRNFESVPHFSSIETYILVSDDEANSRLIDFIKGLREDI